VYAGPATPQYPVAAAKFVIIAPSAVIARETPGRAREKRKMERKNPEEGSWGEIATDVRHRPPKAPAGKPCTDGNSLTTRLLSLLPGSLKVFSRPLNSRNRTTEKRARASFS
jgi:hypothetical protein